MKSKGKISKDFLTIPIQMNYHSIKLAFRTTTLVFKLPLKKSKKALPFTHSLCRVSEIFQLTRAVLIVYKTTH